MRRGIGGRCMIDGARTSKLKDSFTIICSILAGLVLFGVVGTIDFQEEQRHTEQDCEMVQLWKQTGGQAGWPAYDGEEVCRGAQSNEKGAGGEQ